MSDKDELLNEYKREISNIHSELKYHFAEIKRLKSYEKKYQLLINSINNYQLPISFY